MAEGGDARSDGPDGVEVEVNEAKVFATATAANWWALFRMRGPEHRFRVLMASLGGDLVAVGCDDRAHADWLVRHLIEHAGLPRSAVRVRPRATRRTAGNA